MEFESRFRTILRSNHRAISKRINDMVVLEPRFMVPDSTVRSVLNGEESRQARIDALHNILEKTYRTNSVAYG